MNIFAGCGILKFKYNPWPRAINACWSFLRQEKGTVWVVLNRKCDSNQ